MATYGIFEKYEDWLRKQEIKTETFIQGSER